MTCGHCYGLSRVSRTAPDTLDLGEGPEPVVVRWRRCSCGRRWKTVERDLSRALRKDEPNA